MRALALISLALLVSGCWTPGPGQIDPTRYPWDQPRLEQVQPPPQPQPHPMVRAQGQVPPLEQGELPQHLQPLPQGSYCIISLDAGDAGGITAGGGNGVNLGCAEPAPPPQPPR